ncbi:zinc-ribbon domain-containing protein [Lactobacillus sp. PV037]|uniref:zinc ribbon domain-containing protein n=1 Tax=unclassified Lactobacillus TaxID=2620435 RepID=UPI00224072DD|nr:MULTISPECIES: zinc ribbon domain-containing protein [unclassified Lactobacillus]QNQ82195.1 zinc-ribbon domain-containing protein [Lactobacillus sp. PV012]QNQ83697.1 zinc-ribbon domain-containing protein [Lactobacillus sp. PV037]
MKTCPNCHAEMTEDVKFCTNCGTKLDSATSQQPNTSNSGVSNGFSNFAETITTNVDFKKEGKNYWSWLKSGWFHPMEEVDGSSWYGISTLVAEIILTFIGVRILIGKGISEAIKGSTISIADKSMITKFVSGLVFKLSLLTIVICAALLAVTYFIRLFVYGRKENPFSFVNEVSHRASLGVIITVLSFLSLALFSSPSIGAIKWNVFLISAGLVLFTLAIYSMIFAGEGAVHDKYFGAILYAIAYAIILYIAWSVIKDMAVSAIMSQFHVDLGQFWNYMGGSRY